ncbi:MAG: RuBisCO accumulation factor 1 [Coleofasciculus sp. G1-WW12-02]|uniref:RuBisCO accumulation factor 1 n=1 Tax=unclassified Coleofasciculus TaxID=2692782 RepID=UPI0032FD96E9
MTEISPANPHHNPQANSETVDADALIQLLRRKERNWVEWGKACQQLQSAGYSSQALFEQTGFEPIQQNQVIVAFQVYETLVKAGVSEAVRSRFERTGSDILYELRILTQPERAAAAEFIVARNLDSDGAREVAKAMKELSRRRNPPEGFSNHPGDAVAYQYWKLAQQQQNLQERSRLVARGLMFAHSQSSRQEIEQLLTEPFGGSRRRAPRLPFYRVEDSEQLPRLLSLVGQFPVTTAEFQQVEAVETKGAFHIMDASHQQQIVAIPGWQIVSKAQEPVAILCNSTQLPKQENEKSEAVLLIVDRKNTQWDADSYFMVDQSGTLAIEWFSEQPDIPLLGQIILVLRPKKILDEPLSRDLWQIDE